MSPRGVAFPELKEQLFTAAERVLLREGPGGLTGRAITREARVATGLLYNHFTDIEEFLAELVLDRGRLAAEGVTRLRSRVGEDTVIGNLTEAALGFGTKVPALATLVRSRPALANRLHEQSPAGAPVLSEIEGAFATYLEAEKELGRIAAGADTQTLAFALVATVHRLVTDPAAGSADLPGRVQQVVAALTLGISSSA
ncbi:MAG: transcriptional regulator, TetR family [Sphaerisporangium sp.]|jgi:AcrR family transcriptional regulator|nr:transcriptional regulator, TetR family [Sphaerisporangium sp.]